MPMSDRLTDGYGQTDILRVCNCIRLFGYDDIMALVVDKFSRYLHTQNMLQYTNKCLAKQNESKKTPD